MPVAHVVEINSVGPGTRQAGSAISQSRLKARMVACIGLKEGEVACSRIRCIASDTDEAHDLWEPSDPVVLPYPVCRVCRPDLPNRRARNSHCEQARLIHCAFVHSTPNTHS